MVLVTCSSSKKNHLWCTLHFLYNNPENNECPKCPNCPDCTCSNDDKPCPACPACPDVDTNCPTVEDIVGGIFPCRTTGLTTGGRYFEINR